MNFWKYCYFLENFFRENWRKEFDGTWWEFSLIIFWFFDKFSAPLTGDFRSFEFLKFLLFFWKFLLWGLKRLVKFSQVCWGLFQVFEGYALSAPGFAGCLRLFFAIFCYFLLFFAIFCYFCLVLLFFAIFHFVNFSFLNFSNFSVFS